MLTSIDAIAFHVRAQNAGLLLERTAEDDYFFSAFELSASNVAVTRAEGRLVRTFPGSVVRVPHERINNSSFRRQLAKLIVSLDMETLEETQPKGPRAAVREDDTVEPRFVTKFLMGILRSLGEPTEDTRFRKNTRDDVIIDADGRIPWRRSPLAFLIKVCIQMITRDHHTADKDTPDLSYKSFMLYFLGHLLEKAIQPEANVPSEDIHILLCKLSRRTKKLDAELGQTMNDFLEQKSTAAREFLQERWRKLENSSRKSSKLLQRDFAADTNQPISNSKPFLEKALNRPATEGTRSTFEPTQTPRVSNGAEACPDYEALRLNDPDDCIALRDIETWVREHMETWIELADDKHAWIKLHNVSQIYKLRALNNYKEFPEEMSIMMVTLLHVWTVIDRQASEENPILFEFYPGFSMELLKPLRLPKRHHLEQLSRVVEYIENRRRGSRGRPSPFASGLQATSLMVSYFGSSGSAKELRKTIEHDAQQAKEAKIQEYHDFVKKYQKLVQETQQMNCDYEKRHRDDHHRVHSPACKR